jgi:hypothetical protein
MTLRALARNFLPIDNSAALTPCAAEARTPFFLTRFNITSLISLPKDMSEVILNLVQKTP